MTVIAAYYTKNAGAIAADTSIMNGAWAGQTVQQFTGKVWRSGDLLFGFSGSLTFHAWWRRQTYLGETDIAGWIHDCVVRFRAEVFAAGHGKIDDSGSKVVDACLLVVSRSGLYQVSPDGGVIPIDAPYSAIGCGRDQAIGALYALSGSKATSRRRVMVAVEAAKRHALGCGGRTEIVEACWGTD